MSNSEAASGAPIRLVVADDQAAVREALATVLDQFDDIVVVATATDGREAVEAAVETDAQVILMDLRMPGTDGVEATRQLTELLPNAAVVVLTTFADDDSILSALDAGARGYLTKDSGRADIARAVRAAAAGQAVFDRLVQERLVATTRANRAAPAPQAPPTDLTPREREVLTLIGAGLPNRAIAEQLFISEATVKTHINNLFAKAGIRDRPDAVRKAISFGFV